MYVLSLRESICDDRPYLLVVTTLCDYFSKHVVDVLFLVRCINNFESNNSRYIFASDAIIKYLVYNCNFVNVIKNCVPHVIQFNRTLLVAAR